MSAFNVRVYNYVDGQQIRIYNTLYNCEDEKCEIVENKQEEEKIDITGVENDEIWKNIEQYEPYLGEMLEDWERVAKSNRSQYSSMSRTIRNIYEITRSNVWEYFVTLTFNPEKVDSFSYIDVVKKLSMWLNNIKKVYAPELKYIVVPELHKSGRFHFHGLFSDIGCMELVDSGKRLPCGGIIYNIGNYKLGFTTATKIKDTGRVSSYVTKYITKELVAVTANKKRYWCSRNLEKPFIQEFVLAPDEVKQMLEDLTEHITYCKTVTNELLGKSTHYIEVSNEI